MAVPRGEIRTLDLLGFLRKSFDCEWQHSKGSEITVYRPGHRKFTLGGHGQNPPVHATVVRRLLKRLGINNREWQHAVAAGGRASCSSH
jgi:hypothetical protein